MHIKPSFVWWGTPWNCSNHGEILEHPGEIKIELTLIGTGVFEGKNLGEGRIPPPPLDNFRTTNSDVMKFCIEIVYH